MTQHQVTWTDMNLSKLQEIVRTGKPGVLQSWGRRELDTTWWLNKNLPPSDMQFNQNLLPILFIPIPKKGNAKECSNYHTIVLISHASKVMLKILQARLQQYVNCELPDVQAGFRKGRRTRDPIAKICWIIEKAREFQKNICFCFIDYAKAFDSCGSQ